MKNSSKKKIQALIIIGVCSTIGIYMGSTVINNATATLVYPRLGAGMRGPASLGTFTSETGGYSTKKITFWVASDPAESPIPASWLDKNNWDVALIPSVMPTANCTPLRVDGVALGNNQLVLFGGGLDVNPTIPSALGIECSIPNTIPPVMYNLVIGFKQEISPETQNDLDLIPRVGSWRGPRGSANGIMPFVLTERNVVSIPWICDAKTSDPDLDGGNLVGPFKVMHVTDTHYYEFNANWIGNNSLWENDAEVIAPDVIVISGDFMEGPDNENHGPYQYEIAYQHVTDLNLPMVIVSGNHDNKNIGPWKHYFGPLFSLTTFDNLKIVGIDSSLPISTGVMNWIDQQSTPRNDGPVLLTCHYDIDPSSAFTSGWVGIGEIMIDKNLTGILVRTPSAARAFKA
ncbi:MAG: metallophosphoesterase family protein [Candidatus Hodarchaeota archaeon]